MGSLEKGRICFLKIKPKEGSLSRWKKKGNPMKGLKNGTIDFGSNMDEPERGFLFQYVLFLA